MTVAHIKTIKMTADQYFELGGDPPGVRLELIDGEIIVSPSGFPRHSRVITQLTRILTTHINAHQLGELFLDTDVPFETHMVRRPDLCFYATAHLNRVTPKRLAPPPDLCIEVLSPGNIDDDRTNKYNLYQKHGVGHYWIIDPEERSAECYALNNGTFELVVAGRGGQIVHFEPFVDLSIPLAELWMPGS